MDVEEAEADATSGVDENKAAELGIWFINETKGRLRGRIIQLTRIFFACLKPGNQTDNKTDEWRQVGGDVVCWTEVNNERGQMTADALPKEDDFFLGNLGARPAKPARPMYEWPWLPGSGALDTFWGTFSSVVGGPNGGAWPTLAGPGSGRVQQACKPPEQRPFACYYVVSFHYTGSIMDGCEMCHNFHNKYVQYVFGGKC